MRKVIIAIGKFVFLIITLGGNSQAALSEVEEILFKLIFRIIFYHSFIIICTSIFILFFFPFCVYHNKAICSHQLLNEMNYSCKISRVHDIEVNKNRSMKREWEQMLFILGVRHINDLLNNSQTIIDRIIKLKGSSSG